MNLSCMLINKRGKSESVTCHITLIMSHSGGESEAIDVKLTGSCQELVGGGELNGEAQRSFAVMKLFSMLLWLFITGKTDQWRNPETRSTRGNPNTCNKRKEVIRGRGTRESREGMYTLVRESGCIYKYIKHLSNRSENVGMYLSLKMSGVCQIKCKGKGRGLLWYKR